MDSREKKRRREQIAMGAESQWLRWLKDAGQVLTTLPLPPAALLDRSHWDDFVYDGGDLFDIGDFTLESLTDDQARALLALLESYVPETEKGLSWLYRSTRVRCGLPDCGLTDSDEASRE